MARFNGPHTGARAGGGVRGWRPYRAGLLLANLPAWASTSHSTPNPSGLGRLRNVLPTSQRPSSRKAGAAFGRSMDFTPAQKSASSSKLAVTSLDSAVRNFFGIACGLGSQSRIQLRHKRRPNPAVMCWQQSPSCDHPRAADGRSPPPAKVISILGAAASQARSLWTAPGGRDGMAVGI